MLYLQLIYAILMVMQAENIGISVASMVPDSGVREGSRNVWRFV